MLERALTLTELGNAHQDLGDARTARDMLERALRIQEAHYGPNHARVAKTFTILAYAHRALATDMLERAVRIEETLYGPDHAPATTRMDFDTIHAAIDASFGVDAADVSRHPNSIEDSLDPGESGEGAGW